MAIESCGDAFQWRRTSGEALSNRYVAGYYARPQALLEGFQSSRVGRLREYLAKNY